MYRTLKIAAVFSVVTLLAGCSALGTVIGTTAEIVIGAAELILQDEAGGTHYTPAHINRPPTRY